WCVCLDGCYFCFFFQAEDGIRDFHVTGVQTCALPIWKFAVNRWRKQISYWWWTKICRVVLLRLLCRRYWKNKMVIISWMVNLERLLPKLIAHHMDPMATILQNHR